MKGWSMREFLLFLPFFFFLLKLWLSTDHPQCVRGGEKKDSFTVLEKLKWKVTIMGNGKTWLCALTCPPASHKAHICTTCQTISRTPLCVGRSPTDQHMSNIWRLRPSSSNLFANTHFSIWIQGHMERFFHEENPETIKSVLPERRQQRGS